MRHTRRRLTQDTSLFGTSTSYATSIYSNATVAYRYAGLAAHPNSHAGQWNCTGSGVSSMQSLCTGCYFFRVSTPAGDSSSSSSPPGFCQRESGPSTDVESAFSSDSSFSSRLSKDLSIRAYGRVAQALYLPCFQVAVLARLCWCCCNALLLFCLLVRCCLMLLCCCNVRSDCCMSALL